MIDKLSIAALLGAIAIAAYILVAPLAGCTPTDTHPPVTCTPETVEWCQDTVVTNVNGGIEGVGK